MNISKVKNGYKILTGCVAWYLTKRLLDRKIDDLFLDRDVNVASVTDAVLIGAGHGAISMAVGITVAETIGKIL